MATPHYENRVTLPTEGTPASPLGVATPHYENRAPLPTEGASAPPLGVVTPHSENRAPLPLPDGPGSFAVKPVAQRFSGMESAIGDINEILREQSEQLAKGGAVIKAQPRLSSSNLSGAVGRSSVSFSSNNLSLSFFFLLQLQNARTHRWFPTLGGWIERKWVWPYLV